MYGSDKGVEMYYLIYILHKKPEGFIVKCRPARFLRLVACILHPTCMRVYFVSKPEEPAGEGDMYLGI